MVMVPRFEKTTTKTLREKSCEKNKNQPHFSDIYINFFTAICCSGKWLFASETHEASLLEERIYWTGTIDESFDDSSVLVVMDKCTGGINKRHDASFFKQMGNKWGQAYFESLIEFL